MTKPTPNRVAIFAHYDSKGLIDDYVIFYLKKLKEFIPNIIFSSDCVIEESELKKLESLVLETVSQRHQQLDFGSHKNGFIVLKDKYPEILAQADELILANDSCYCIRSFDKIFETISDDKKNKVFGLTDNYEQSYHLQSYFLLMKKEIFQSDFFQSFLLNVKKLDQKRDIIKNYEIGFSELLREKEVAFRAIFPYESSLSFIDINKEDLVEEFRLITKKFSLFLNPEKIYQNLRTTTKEHGFSYNDGFLILIKQGFPLIKIRLIKGFFYSKKRNNVLLSYFWQKCPTIKASEAYGFILKNCKRFKKCKNESRLIFDLLRVMITII